MSQFAEPAVLASDELAVPFVSEGGNSKSLHFSHDQTQSSMSTSHPDELALDYTKTMMGFLLLNRHPHHIGMIGLGGGSLAKFCMHNLPQTRMTVAEINPHVIALRDEFLVPQDSERFKVIQGCGADFIADAEDESFDVLLVDGFDQKGLPTQLGSQAFYENCRAALTDHGVIVLNMHALDPSYELLLDRIARSFDGNLAEVRVKQDGNTIVFASKNMPITAHGLRGIMPSDEVPGGGLKALKNVFQQVAWQWQNPKN